MANTVIQLRKSAVPLQVPSDLANGEIAINYADGKLFYKDALGVIQQISSGGNTFSTVNAAGTLLVSDLPSDILSIVAGNNISITADALTDTLTISSNGGASVATSDSAPGTSVDGDLWYNTTIGKLLVYYDDGDSSQWVEASTGQIYSDALIVAAAFDKANSANLLAYGTGIGANAYTRVFANSVGAAANAYADSLTPDLSPVFLVANAAFDKANTATFNAFYTIQVSGQSNIVAASNADTLTFATDGTLNITTNTSTKTVTLAVANTEDYGLITGSVTLTDDYGSVA